MVAAHVHSMNKHLRITCCVCTRHSQKSAALQNRPRAHESMSTHTSSPECPSRLGWKKTSKTNSKYTELFKPAQSSLGKDQTVPLLQQAEPVTICSCVHFFDYLCCVLCGLMQMPKFITRACNWQTLVQTNPEFKKSLNSWFHGEELQSVEFLCFVFRRHAFLITGKFAQLARQEPTVL